MQRAPLPCPNVTQALRSIYESALSISPASQQVSVTTHCQQIPMLIIQNFGEFLAAIFSAAHMHGAH